MCSSRKSQNCLLLLRNNKKILIDEDSVLFYDKAAIYVCRLM